MSMHGADVEQLRATATQFNKSASVLESSASTLHSLINGSTQWRGPDAERFRSEWSGVSARSLSAAVETLRRASDELRRNADQQDQASGEGNSAPQGTSGLLKHLENDQRDDRGNATGDTDGLRIERVVGPDGQTRLIVYLKGQDSVDSRGLDRSAALATGLMGVDPDLTRKIDEALKSTPNGLRTEVMLVGLSQGGMDAQNIAAAGRYNVTNLVTYGSPLIQFDKTGIDTVHIEASGDPVPGAGELARVAADVATNPSIFGAINVATDAAHGMANGNIYTFDPQAGIGFNVHETAYPDAAKAFDQSTDPRFAETRQSMKRFEGTVTSVTE